MSDPKQGAWLGQAVVAVAPALVTGIVSYQVAVLQARGTTKTRTDTAYATLAAAVEKLAGATDSNRQDLERLQEYLERVRAEMAKAQSGTAIPAFRLSRASPQIKLPDDLDSAIRFNAGSKGSPEGGESRQESTQPPSRVFETPSYRMTVLAAWRTQGGAGLRILFEGKSQDARVLFDHLELVDDRGERLFPYLGVGPVTVAQGYPSTVIWSFQTTHGKAPSGRVFKLRGTEVSPKQERALEVGAIEVPE